MHHLSGDSKDVVKQGLALIATLTALVLPPGGPRPRERSTPRARRSKKCPLMWWCSTAYWRAGPETKEARAMLAGGQAHAGPDVAGRQRACGQPDIVRSAGCQGCLFEKDQRMQPKTETQQLLKARALELTISLTQTRQKLMAQREFDTGAVPVRPGFLAHDFVWLLWPPGAQSDRHRCSWFTCCRSRARSFGPEMDRPFDGIMQVPSAPASSRTGAARRMRVAESSMPAKADAVESSHDPIRYHLEIPGARTRNRRTSNSSSRAAASGHARFGMFMSAEEPLTPEEIAREYDLPVEAVREAIAYCQSDPPEIKDDFEREERLMEASGMNDPDYKYGGKFKIVPPEEIVRILNS